MIIYATDYSQLTLAILQNLSIMNKITYHNNKMLTNYGTFCSVF